MRYARWLGWWQDSVRRSARGFVRRSNIGDRCILASKNTSGGGMFCMSLEGLLVMRDVYF